MLGHVGPEKTIHPYSGICEYPVKSGYQQALNCHTSLSKFLRYWSNNLAAWILNMNMSWAQLRLPVMNIEVRSHWFVTVIQATIERLRKRYKAFGPSKDTDVTGKRRSDIPGQVQSLIKRLRKRCKAFGPSKGTDVTVKRQPDIPEQAEERWC